MPLKKYSSQQNSQRRDSESQGFKQVSFELLHCLHRSNQSIHNLFYYSIMLIQFLQIFYYITHPFLPYYKNSSIMNIIHEFLKYLVFNQFLVDDSSLYQIVIPVFVVFVMVQVVLVVVMVREIRVKKLVNEVKKMHLVGNVMFLVFNSVMTIPVFGMSLNVLYCDPEANIYTLGQSCYQGAHIGYCFLASFLIASLVIQMGINWYIYYNKNPFGTDFLAKYQNNAVLGKFLIKVIPVIYFSVDMNLNYVNVFIFGITACLLGYVFFFRLFAFHDYNEIIFYLQLFLEVVLAWFTVNNIILSYMDTEGKAGGLFQSFLCSFLVGALVIQVQEENYQKIFMQGMQSQKIKKQNIEKFLYRLIYKFSHAQTNDQKNHISTIIKILNSRLRDPTVDPSLKTSKRLQKKFYSFLSRFVLQYLKQNWNIMLMSMNCSLLMMQQKYSYAFHQSLQLSSKKISMVEELMMYRFRRHPRYDREKLDMSKKESNNIFMMYYDFNQNLMKLQQEIAACTFNNLDYWEEVCQTTPSIYKIRNLAEKYQHHQELIDRFYMKIYDTFPNNKFAIKTYIQFLMYVGVNVNSLTRAKQRYQQAEENIKKTQELQRDSGNLIEMGENQNLAYVSIETSEMSLATIINCNTEFKNMLGYDKHELIDKKVNKIMPKAFNQFHDNLIRNYIQKKERMQKNKVQRIVYALSKDNLLVEVVLFTKVNFKAIGSKSSLQLIGFLKKIQDPQKSVILVELHSQNIVGANAAFSTLIEKGISNLQFANSQIKIATLLPNLNTTLVEQSKPQQTNLIFSSSVLTKSGMNLQVKKKIMIEVQQVREYFSSKQKFAYLAIKELEGDQNTLQASGKTLQAQVRIVKQRNEVKEQDKDNKKKIRQNIKDRKITTTQVSIMQDEFSASINSYDSETIREAINTEEKEEQQYRMIERKKEEFLKNQHLQMSSLVLWIGLVLFISITMGLLISSIDVNVNMITANIQIKGQVQNCYVVTYQTAEICKDVEKVMLGSAYNATEFSQNALKLGSSIDDFQHNFIPLMTLSTKYDFPLELNQFQYYDVVIEKDAGILQYADETAIDAFFQFISTSKNYVTFTLDYIATNGVSEMVQENVFIQENGKQLFPNITKRMSLEYLELDEQIFDQHTNIQLILTLCYAANVILAISLIAILTKKINTFSLNVVQIYNQIRLWDASQMKSKCIKFIQKNSTGIMKNYNTNRRISSLLNVFPQQAFLQVIQQIAQSQPNGKGEGSSGGQEDHLLREQTTTQVDEVKQRQQQKRGSIRQRKFYVYLTQKNKLRGKFLIFCTIASLLVGAYFLQHFYTNQYQRQVLYYNHRISQLGRVRNNLAFINYYTYQIMLTPQDQTYRRLLKSQISQFYVNTDSCYDLIGDPSTILKDSYSLVEEVAAIVFSDTINLTSAERYSIRNPKYLLQEELFGRNVQLITELINVDLAKIRDQIFSSIKSIKLTFVIMFILVNLALVLAIKWWMLEEILQNSKKSKCMINMLPPWLIERCKGIADTLQ